MGISFQCTSDRWIGMKHPRHAGADRKVKASKKWSTNCRFFTINWWYSLIYLTINDIVNSWLLNHCKDTIPKFQNKYSQKRNCAAQSQLLHSCVCERFIYSHDPSACSTAEKYVERSWEYINRSETVEIRTEAAQFLFWGIHKWEFLCVDCQILRKSLSYSPWTYAGLKSLPYPTSWTPWLMEMFSSNEQPLNTPPKHYN
jgi:hypothetical protein